MMSWTRTTATPAGVIFAWQLVACLTILPIAGTTAAFSILPTSTRLAGIVGKSTTQTATRQSPKRRPLYSQQTSHDEKQKLRTTNNDAQDDNVPHDAHDALRAVGWSMPAAGKLTADDPFVMAIDRSIQRDFGVPLDELLNPAKVVNLERDLYELRRALAAATGQVMEDEAALTTLSTQECDGGGGGSEAEELRTQIRKKEASLLIERRSVFRGWLKNVFLVQAILSFGLSIVMASSPQSLFGGYDWYYKYNMDISISVLGYWWWWLFIIPSLRSRRPKGNEKQALDLAFLASPLVSLVAPVATKDTFAIWCANAVVVAACFGFAYLVDMDSDGRNDGGSSDSNQPEWLQFVFKSLDFGSGRERGARK